MRRARKCNKKNIKTLYESQEKVIRLFNDYFKVESEAKYKAQYAEGLKRFTPKQMLDRLQIAFVQVIHLKTY